MRAGRWTASPTLFMCKVASSFLEGPPQQVLGGCPEASPVRMHILIHPCHVLYSLLVCVPVPAPASASSGVLPWVWCYVRVMLLQTWCKLLVLDKYLPGIGEAPRWIPIQHQRHQNLLRVASTFRHLPHTAYTFLIQNVYRICTYPPLPTAATRQLGVSYTYNWGPILRA